MSKYQAGLKDIRQGASAIEVWWSLAFDAIQTRYNRTLLGPLWLVLGQAIWVGAMVLVFSYSFGHNPATYAPYVASGFAAWVFISSILVDAPFIFLREKSTLEAFDLPVSVYLFSSVAEKMFIMLHHMAIYVFCVIVFAAWPGIHVWLVLPAICVYLVAAMGVTLIVAVLGARYRDIQPALQSLTGLVFILTPIFWDRSMFATRAYVVDWNPFYHFIEIMRGPLLGVSPSLVSWVVATLIALSLLAIGTSVFSRNKSFLMYWI